MVFIPNILIDNTTGFLISLVLIG